MASRCCGSSAEHSSTQEGLSIVEPLATTRARMRCHVWTSGLVVGERKTTRVAHRVGQVLLVGVPRRARAAQDGGVIAAQAGAATRRALRRGAHRAVVLQMRM